MPKYDIVDVRDQILRDHCDWHVVLYAGHLYQPFWIIKIQQGRQEGPKTAKSGYICTLTILDRLDVLNSFGLYCKNCFKVVHLTILVTNSTCLRWVAHYKFFDSFPIVWGTKQVTQGDQSKMDFSSQSLCGACLFSVKSGPEYHLRHLSFSSISALGFPAV